MNHSPAFFIFSIVVFCVVVAIAVFGISEKKEKPVACTMDAKICPDGTAVGRTGPKCEFQACPPVVMEKAGLIKVTTSFVNGVKSPLELAGEARGTWYFEASFPVQIYDAHNVLLGSVPAQAQGEWMTENYVPFKATLTFTAPATETGYIVFKKDNPSGLPEHDDALRIPVRFDMSAPETRTVNLYYYNPAGDKDAQGNIMCTKKGLVPVSRSIPVTQSVVQDTVKLLLKGELTTAEKAAGVTTEFPLPGVNLLGVSTKGGVLTLAFSDPLHKTTGGACRAGVLWAQIKATAEQFPGVTNVAFSPTDLFQP